MVKPQNRKQKKCSFPIWCLGLILMSACSVAAHPVDNTCAFFKCDSPSEVARTGQKAEDNSVSKFTERAAAHCRLASAVSAGPQEPSVVDTSKRVVPSTASKKEGGERVQSSAEKSSNTENATSISRSETKKKEPQDTSAKIGVNEMQTQRSAQIGAGEQFIEAPVDSESSIVAAESEVVLSPQDTIRKKKARRGVTTIDTKAPVTVQQNGITLRPLRDTLSRETESTASMPDTLTADSTVKKGFFHKFYNYFKSANVDKTLTKKFDFSVIGGPHYSSDVKLGLGIVAAGLYRVDRKDLTIPPSNVSLFGDITTTGFWMLGIRGNTFFNSGKLRLDYTTYFFSFPSAYWGIGYDNGMYATAGSYKRLQSQVKINLLFQLKPKLYLGPGFNFNYTRGEKFSNIEMLNGENQQYISTGVGVILMYDSRDIIYNASRGIYARFEQFVYPTFFGNSKIFTQTELTFDAYHKLWKGATMAYDVYAQFSGGQTPWTMLPRLGGSLRMRGYYEGRYRDRQMVEVQAELRQHIYNRHGVAVWVGAGNVFPDFNKFNPAHTLPNWGIGYRWEFKNKVNVRFDYGFGKGESSFLFSINEAF